uniref:Uncharacterized protein n=1 Tax=Salix viminalis TaxID=40686 RepID=A0A6N2KTQ8_SALVM
MSSNSSSYPTTLSIGSPAITLLVTLASQAEFTWPCKSGKFKRESWTSYSHKYSFSQHLHIQASKIFDVNNTDLNVLYAWQSFLMKIYYAF